MEAVEKFSPQALRRSGRILREIRILLIGTDAQGVGFMEHTKTIVLSRHGAGIVSAHKLVAEQELLIVHQERNKETEIRVVGQIGYEDGLYNYGVAFLDPAVDFWGAEVPSPSRDEIFACRKTLQCNICGHREHTDLGDFELDIYAIRDSILRSCNQCNSLTLWKQPFSEILD